MPGEEDMRLAAYASLASFMKDLLKLRQVNQQPLVKTGLECVSIVHKALVNRKKTGLTVPMIKDFAAKNNITLGGAKKRLSYLRPGAKKGTQNGKDGALNFKNVAKTEEDISDIQDTTPPTPVYPDNPPTKMKHELYEEWMERVGNFHLLRENYDQAIAMVNKGLRIDARNPAYFYKRAICYSHMDSHDLCLQDLEKAREVNSDYRKTYGFLAMQYTDMGLIKKAKDAFDRALSFDPSNELFNATLQVIEGQLAYEEDRSINNEPTGYYLNTPPARRYDPDVLHAARELIREPGSYAIISGILSRNTIEPNPVGKILEYWITRKQGGKQYDTPTKYVLEDYSVEEDDDIRLGRSVYYTIIGTSNYLNRPN